MTPETSFVLSYKSIGLAENIV